MNITWWKKLLQEIKHLHNSQLEGKKFLNQLASSLQLGNWNPASYKTLLYFKRDDVLVHLQGVGTHPAVLSSFIPARARQHRKSPKPVCGYLCPELPWGTAQLPASTAASRTAATTAPLLLLPKWTGCSSESPWTIANDGFAQGATSLLPIQAPFSASLWYKVVPFLSHFAAAQQVAGSESRWLRGSCCPWAADTGSRTGPGKEESMPEIREEMKEWLPPTSTPSLSALHPPGSSQNNPTLRHVPLSCHASYLHFKMGFCLCDSEPRAAPLSDELPHLNTHLPSSKNIPPTRDYRAKVVWRGTCLSPLLDLLSLIAVLTLPF